MQRSKSQDISPSSEHTCVVLLQVAEDIAKAFSLPLSKVVHVKVRLLWVSATGEDVRDRRGAQTSEGSERTLSNSRVFSSWGQQFHVFAASICAVLHAC